MKQQSMWTSRKLAVTSVILFLYLYTISFHKVFKVTPNWEKNTSRLYIVTLLFNLYAEYIMRNAGLDEAQAGIKIVGRNINHLRYADDTTLMVESEEELKSLLMKVKSGEWKNWLKAQHSENEDHGILSHHFMGNRWGNSGNTVRLYFSGLQNHCRWWLQPWN